MHCGIENDHPPTDLSISHPPTVPPSPGGTKLTTPRHSFKIVMLFGAFQSNFDKKCTWPGGLGPGLGTWAPGPQHPSALGPKRRRFEALTQREIE